jgi:hypothetical protein
MPLYFKNKEGLRRGIRDNSKIIQVIKEFNNDPENEDFVIYVDCNALFYHPNFDGYNFDDITNDPKDMQILLLCPQSFYTNFQKL